MQIIRSDKTNYLVGNPQMTFLKVYIEGIQILQWKQ